MPPLIRRSWCRCGRRHQRLTRKSDRTSGDTEGLEKLREYRQQLKVPGFFGAPFGFAEADGTTHIVVAIRGICWEGDQISLPSGCGIVGGSAFDHEWRELRLKREAVLRLLALQS